MDVAELQTVIDAVPMPVIYVGTDERVGATNAAAARIFDVPLSGRHYIAILRQPGLLDCVEAALQGRRSKGQYLTTEGGRETTYEVEASPVGTGQGAGALICLRDISALQDAIQMRRDFVANVSHELRSPLTALLGFIETLRGPARDDPPAQLRFLNIMEREAQRMTRLISDLLSLSRVESEARMRPRDLVDLADVLRATVATLSPQLSDAGVEIRQDLPEGPVTVPGDQDQLTQVFTNLIENAVKYGGGPVRIRISPARHDPALRSNAIRVAVSDSGEGIDPRHLPRLTERFYRVDSHRSREVGGTGLGLAIVKHIVNRHRGRLKVESVSGEGSTFTVVLPVA